MIQTGQLLLALAILVLLHELGHFIPAKLFKTRVDKFYLFFNPWFSVVKKRIGETEYGLGWLPLGGYVKIAGMIDESMDKEQMKTPAQPWEFRSKPAWQRLIIMLGGIFVNVVLGWVIFSGIYMFYGEEILPIKNLKFGIYADPVLRDIGFRNGDKIIKVGNEDIGDETDLGDVSWKILMKEVPNVQVLRGSETVTINIPEDIDTKILAKDEPKFFEVPFPFIADSIMVNSNAFMAGLKKDDRIIKINSDSTPSYFSVKESLSNNKGKNVNVLINRHGTTMTLKSHVSEEGTLGIYPRVDLGSLYEFKTKKYGFLESLGKGANITGDLLIKNVTQFKLLFNENGTKHMGSLLAMRKQFAPVWNWQSFWLLTANLSLVLAFFNLLPIPGLDGGHAMFTVYEMITKKKPSQKFQEVTQTIGMILLLMLMFFALGNDIFRGNF